MVLTGLYQYVSFFSGLTLGPIYVSADISRKTRKNYNYLFVER